MKRKRFLPTAILSQTLTYSVLATTLLLYSPQPAVAQFPTIMVATPFPNSDAVASHGVAVDSNGIVWYVPVGASLVRQDPSFCPGNPAGITIIPLPHSAVNLAIDNQDNVWISCSDGFVTKFDPILNNFTNFDTSPGAGCDFLDHIHFHSDGNVYTTCLDGNLIIRINQPAGTVDTFPTPTANSATAGITGDFTGILWAIERSADNVVRADPVLMVPCTPNGITEFAIPNSPYSPETVKGCGDRIWFTGLSEGPNGPRVSFIDINTTVITQFDVDPGASGGTYGLAVDGDGNPFATNPGSPKVYGLEISTTNVTVFPTPSNPHHIAISPTTGNLWYTNFQAEVVQLVPDVPVAPTCEPTEPPCDPVEDPDVRTQGFWKRVCRGPHPSGEHENLPGYVDCVNLTDTFADVDDVDALCDRLQPSPPNDKCEQAEAQFMALLLNVCSGRVAECNCTDDPDVGPATVGEVIVFIDDLLSNPDRTFDDCVLAQSIADLINNGLTLVDCR